MCVVSVIVKRPVQPPSVVDGRSRNPLYYYYFIILDNNKDHHIDDAMSSFSIPARGFTTEMV